MWNFPLFPDQASTISSKIDALFFYELAISAFFTALICVLIVSLAVRYRRKANVNRSNPPTSSSVLEVLWIGIPLILAMTMFAWGAQLYYEAYQPPADASEIQIVGKQWMWYVQHPEGRGETNELHVPLGRPVKLTMISQDVIHSFFIPAFRMKQDVLPGRYTTAWFEPSRVGTYHLFCAEYCGTNHSLMKGLVHVMDPADYEQWLAESGSGPSLATLGKVLFTQHHCAGCHGDSQTVHAPRLEGVYGNRVPIQEGTGENARVHFVTADDRYIRDSILLPKSQVVAGYEPVMPSYEGQISERDLLKIMAYIKSIGRKEAPR
jgi:cytochrome c oxidase subunit 2